MTYVSICIQNSFETSQDAFEWIIRKRLETLWMNFECVLRRFRMISQSVSRRFGIYSKRLKTLLNESFESVLRRFRINTKASWDTSNKYQSVLRHFGKSFESVSRRIQYSFKVSQDTLKIYSKASWDVSNDFWMRLKTQVTFRIKVPSLGNLSNIKDFRIFKPFQNWKKNKGTSLPGLLFSK